MHRDIYVHVCSMHLRRDTFCRVPRMKIDDFGGLCLTNAHLAFGPKRFSRRFAPQNDKGYGITTSPLMAIIILPLLESDAAE